MSEDAWKTPAIREAEAALDRSVSKSRQLLKDLEKIKLPPAPDPATPERIAALRAAASRPDAPAHLRLIKRKVDAGELTWEDVAAGRAFADPEVRQLAMGQLTETKEMYQELRDGATPEEVLEARTGGTPGSPLAEGGRSAYPPPPPVSAPDPSADPLGRTAPRLPSRPPIPHRPGTAHPSRKTTPPTRSRVLTGRRRRPARHAARRTRWTTTTTSAATICTTDPPAPREW